MDTIGKKLKLLSVASLFLVAGLLKAGNCQAVDHAYVTNSGGDTVSVIDTTTKTAGTPLSGFNHPYGVAIAPQAGFLYVTNLGYNTVIRTDLTSGDRYSCPSGPDPRGIAVSSDGTKVYVTAHDSSNPGLSIITFPGCSEQYITYATAPTAPFGVAINPAGTYLYMTDESSDDVQVIDLATNTAGTPLPVGVDQTNFPAPEGPKGVAVSPNGQYVVVANSLSNSISIINTKNSNATSMVAVGAAPFGVAIAADNVTAYVSNHDDDTISVVKLDTGTVIATVSVGDNPNTVPDGPSGISITPDGADVYVVNNLTDTVSVIETATNTVVETIPVGAGPIGFGKFIGGMVPAAPTDLKAMLVGDTTITLSWTDNATDESGYKVLRKKYVEGGYKTIATLPPDTTSYTDNNLEHEANYYYKVVAYNYDGYSAYSNEAYATVGSENYGCFIATAAYGSLLEPQVALLRGFRDRFLVGNRPGRAFLRFYYKNSPPFAHFIAVHDFLRFLVRWSLLPLVGFSWLALTFGLLPALTFMILAPTLLAGLGFYHRKNKLTGRRPG